MDLNYLFYRQQISLLRARSAANPESRAAHEGLAKGYTEQILAYRNTNHRLETAEREVA
ncbi:hypothetical protein [Rhizorhapis sp. SPR117]|uniref:hypothetical protein n=1 Tax=Rhizorhapis sp. SPR117 TaxID=2912611 RepID=UPI001F18C8CA|nr:hypothetical protein [Rhizorhapis sp. SPR117]